MLAVSRTLMQGVTGVQGDQYVVLNVRLPREVNEQQRRLLENFREEEQQRKKKAA